MRRLSRSEWRRLVDAHADSGKTLAEFARARRLKLATFRWWRKRLRRESRPAAPAPTPTAHTAGPETASEVLTVRVVEALEQTPGVSARRLALDCALPGPGVLATLRELEALGLVFRTGEHRATRWYLG